jgi:hypothetical protein
VVVVVEEEEGEQQSGSRKGAALVWGWQPLHASVALVFSLLLLVGHLVLSLLQEKLNSHAPDDYARALPICAPARRSSLQSLCLLASTS